MYEGGCYYAHFTVKKTEAYRVRNLPKATGLVPRKGRIETQTWLAPCLILVPLLGGAGGHLVPALKDS